MDKDIVFYDGPVMIHYSRYEICESLLSLVNNI